MGRPLPPYSFPQRYLSAHPGAYPARADVKEDDRCVARSFYLLSVIRVAASRERRCEGEEALMALELPDEPRRPIHLGTPTGLHWLDS